MKHTAEKWTVGIASLVGLGILVSLLYEVYKKGFHFDQYLNMFVTSLVLLVIVAVIITFTVMQMKKKKKR
jgi:ABC-type multidrug transport system permease subunit